MELKQVLPLQVRVDLRIMVMKWNSTFPQSSSSRASQSDGLVSYSGHLFSRDSQHILQPKLTGLVQVADKVRYLAILISCNYLPLS